ncbi:HlyD family type I secretion periplasmic adaptor subunit [Devosia sp.]|uniref:HlyD family type I secretion periplasmic adaptor subunit n=1 Tax=Devosia sp. TaxID=1871048 RepID=UPI003BACEEE2
MRGHIVLGVALAIALVGGIGTWAFTSKIAGAVVSSGTVLVDGEVKSVQQIDGGVVKQLLVRDGDQVSAGDVLLRLDDVQIRAERDIILGQLGELVGRQARLQAERDLSETIVFPANFDTSFVAGTLVRKGEQQVFEGGLRSRKSQKDQLTLQISQLNDEINGLKAQQQAQIDELELTQADRTNVADLVKGKLVEAARLLATDRDIARMKGRLGDLQASLARAKGRISEINLQIVAIDDLARNDAQRELRTVEGQANELQERLRAVEARLARAEVRSPATGTVNELAVHTIGGVITPAQLLMSVVPSDSLLDIEFRVATKDIDQISVGQATRLRFSAFNRRTTPELTGEVTQVSASATRDPITGERFYLARVKVTGDMSELDGKPLVPGMPVEVFVQTGEQVAIAYFLKPFTDQISLAFREE